MQIELHQIPVRDLFEGYSNRQEEGVWAFGGRLNIRPPYQREFVYKPEQQAAVIDTVRKGFPLNVMYWVKTGTDPISGQDTFEMLDGQQRSMSICQYLWGAFSVDWEGNLLAFHNLKDDQKERLLGYPLMVYFCDGTDSEKIEWFKTINLVGERLFEQEILNAVYSGPWTAAAKRVFSKSGCAAYGLGNPYLNGTPLRQDYLATALHWITNGRPKGAEQYMSQHQHDTDCDELWQYFQDVIHWIQKLFPKPDKLMKGLPWGLYFNEFKGNTYSATKLAEQVKALKLDDEVTNKKGIYPYLLSGDERRLSLRAFTEAQRLVAYEACGGQCAHCGEHFDLSEMEADHITPWSQGGHTTLENCQMLCRTCNRKKSDK